MDITGSVKDINLAVNSTPEQTQKAISGLVGTESILALTFSNNGVLPGLAQIRVYAGEKFVSGDVINSYFYNEQTQKPELVGSGLVVDGSGYVGFVIDHCSTYFLTKAVIKGAVKNISGKSGWNQPVTWQIIVGVSVLINLGLISIIVRQRKIVKTRT